MHPNVSCVHQVEGGDGLRKITARLDGRHTGHDAIERRPHDGVVQLPGGLVTSGQGAQVLRVLLHRPHGVPVQAGVHAGELRLEGCQRVLGARNIPMRGVISRARDDVRVGEVLRAPEQHLAVAQVVLRLPDLRLHVPIVRLQSQQVIAYGVELRIGTIQRVAVMPGPQRVENLTARDALVFLHVNLRDYSRHIGRNADRVGFHIRIVGRHARATRGVGDPGDDERQRQQQKQHDTQPATRGRRSRLHRRRRDGRCVHDGAGLGRARLCRSRTRLAEHRRRRRSELALREQRRELLVVDDVLADQQAAGDVVAEIGPARSRPPAPDRRLASMPDDDQVRFHLLGVGADLTRRLTDGELARSMEAERRESRHALLQYALVVLLLLRDASASDSLTQLGARLLPG